MNKPLVSIICIAYNHEPYIRECLESFLAQETKFPIEILVNDDCSKDKTVEIIREFENNHPDLFRCVYQSENQYSKGVHPWFDILFPMAQGKYIALCEGDDFWTDPKKLQKQVDILKANEKLMAVVTNTSQVDANGKILLEKEQGIVHDNIEGIYTLRDFFKTPQHCYPTATVVFRNNHSEEVIKKMQHTRNPYFADWILWIVLHTFGPFYYLDEVTSAYRINPTSITHTQWVKGRVDKVKMEFELDLRIADIFPEEYSDIAEDFRNTNWIHGALVKAYYKDKSYLKMVGQLFVVTVKYPRYYKEIIYKVLNKIKRKLHIK